LNSSLFLIYSYEVVFTARQPAISCTKATFTPGRERVISRFSGSPHFGYLLNWAFGLVSVGIDQPH